MSKKILGAWEKPAVGLHVAPKAPDQWEQLHKVLAVDDRAGRRIAFLYIWWMRFYTHMGEIMKLKQAFPWVDLIAADQHTHRNNYDQTDASADPYNQFVDEWTDKATLMAEDGNPAAIENKSESGQAVWDYGNPEFVQAKIGLVARLWYQIGRFATFYALDNVWNQSNNPVAFLRPQVSQERGMAYRKGQIDFVRGLRRQIPNMPIVANGNDDGTKSRFLPEVQGRMYEAFKPEEFFTSERAKRDALIDRTDRWPINIAFDHLELDLDIGITEAIEMQIVSKLALACILPHFAYMIKFEGRAPNGVRWEKQVASSPFPHRLRPEIYMNMGEPIGSFQVDFGPDNKPVAVTREFENAWAIFNFDTGSGSIDRKVKKIGVPEGYADVGADVVTGG